MLFLVYRHSSLLVFSKAFHSRAIRCLYYLLKPVSLDRGFLHNYRDGIGSRGEGKRRRKNQRGGMMRRERKVASLSELTEEQRAEA